ncbi:MAG: hypothetical protein SGARI_007301 [Bacillariaceae sp.]
MSTRIPSNGLLSGFIPEGEMLQMNVVAMEEVSADPESFCLKLVVSMEDLEPVSVMVSFSATLLQGFAQLDELSVIVDNGVARVTELCMNDERVNATVGTALGNDLEVNMRGKMHYDTFSDWCIVNSLK